MKMLSALKNTTQKGFTLIELLVVIGILGILAAALVATIDPFEQLKKGTDSKIQNIVVEFMNGNIRYFTTHNDFPWDIATSGCNAGGTLTGGFTAQNLETSVGPGGEGCIAPLINEGELKQGFTNNTTDDLDEIFVSHSTANNELIVCFNPQSRSQRSGPNAIYNSDGTTGGAAATAGCPANDPACFWCTR